MGAAAIARVVAAGVVAPARRDPSVVEHRLAVDRDLHEPLQALDRAEEHVVGLDVAGRAPLAGGAARLRPRAYAERVANDEQAAPRHPRRLQDHAREEVPLAGRHEHARGADPEAPRSAVEQRSEDARRVQIGKAEPLDVAAAGRRARPPRRRRGRRDRRSAGTGRRPPGRSLRAAPAHRRRARDRARRRRLWRGGTERTAGAVIERHASAVATRSSTAGAWRGARRGRRA